MNRATSQRPVPDRRLRLRIFAVEWAFARGFGCCFARPFAPQVQQMRLKSRLVCGSGISILPTSLPSREVRS